MVIIDESYYKMLVVKQMRDADSHKDANTDRKVTQINNRCFPEQFHRMKLSDQL